VDSSSRLRPGDADWSDVLAEFGVMVELTDATLRLEEPVEERQGQAGESASSHH
jgi:hypothetical protein